MTVIDRINCDRPLNTGLQMQLLGTDFGAPEWNEVRLPHDLRAGLIILS
jgi:hypothetical protein